MAGNYPDVPAPRMAYDRDGSVLTLLVDSASPVERSGAEAQELNNEDNDACSWLTAVGVELHCYFGIIFPELRDVEAYFLNFGALNVGQSMGALEYSANTTNLQDGTWTTKESDAVPYVGNTDPNYRSNIHSLSTPITGAKAIRIRIDRVNGGDNLYVRKFHVYGDLSSGETPNKLHIWDPYLDQEVDAAYFDRGNAPEGTTQDIIFRVKNTSSTLDAEDITVSTDALTVSAEPEVLTLSDDGSTFASSINITSLVAGDISDICTLRRALPSDATLGLATFRLIASAVSWT